MDFRDRIKQWLLGVLLPVIFLFYSFRYLTGQDLYSARTHSYLGYIGAFKAGLCQLGIAICLHAIFFEAYNRFPLLKWVLTGVGIVVWAVGVFLSYGD